MKSSNNGKSVMKSASSAASKIFKDKSEWVNIENWQYYACAIKKT